VLCGERSGQHGVRGKEKGRVYCKTNLNREGRSQPANSQNRAFGDISPGRPWNLASCTSWALVTVFGVSQKINKKSPRQSERTDHACVPNAEPRPMHAR
jgi:hypothetical protein